MKKLLLLVTGGLLVCFLLTTGGFTGEASADCYTCKIKCSCNGGLKAVGTWVGQLSGPSDRPVEEEARSDCAYKCFTKGGFMKIDDITCTQEPESKCE